MYAIRDQENLINTHQTAAAAKSLNRGVGGHAPKTPADKLAKQQFNGRATTYTNRKGDENAFVGNSKANLGKNTFVTPAPQERAPLGAKTTNAKSQAFQTPAPLLGGNTTHKTHRTSASARKSKLKIHQQVEPTDVAAAEDEHEEEEPEIEYAPPKITELPDWPDEDTLFPPGTRLPQFEGDNFSRGWYQIYSNRIGDDGLTRSERESRKADEVIDNMIEKKRQQLRKEAFEALGVEERQETLEHGISRKLPTPKSVSSAPKQPINVKSKPSTLTSRAAATALSHSSTSSRTPNFAAPTMAARARNTAEPDTYIPKSSARQNTPGTVASRTTIGYSKGRKVSSSMKQLPDAPNRTANKAPTKQRDNTVEAEDALLRDLLAQSHLQDGEGDDLEDDLFKDNFGGKDWFQEQMEKEFVLDMPEIA